MTTDSIDLLPPDLPPRRWPRVVIPLTTIAVLAGIYAVGHLPAAERAATVAAAAPTGPRPIRSRIGSPQPGPKQQAVTVIGTVEAVEAATVHARVGGTVASREVVLGQVVKAGQVLFTLDDPLVAAQVAVAEATLGERQAAVRQAVSRLGVAKAQRQRGEALGPAIVTAQDQEDRRAAEAVAEADVAAAEARVRAAEAERQRLATLQEHLRITSPLDGTVTRIAVERGELVPAGGGGGTEVVITALDRLRVRIDVPQVTAGGLVAGLPVSLVPRNGPPLAAAISRTSGVLSAKARALTAEIDLPPEARLLAGAAVTVTFQRPVARPSLRVPSEALLSGSAGAQVAVLDEQQRAKLVKVVVESDDGQLVTIASGLAPTDQVLLNPSGAVEDGRPVVVLPDPVPATPAATPPAGVR